MFIAGSQKSPEGSGPLGRELLRRVDAQTGETLQDFVGNRQGSWWKIEFSAAQDLMVSTGGFSRVAVWKLPEGKVLRDVEVSQGGAGVPSPDGKILWRSLGSRGSLIEDLMGRHTTAIRCESDDAMFSPDGRLFTLEHIGAIKGETAGTPKWLERRTDGDFALLPEVEGQAEPEAGCSAFHSCRRKGSLRLFRCPVSTK